MIFMHTDFSRGDKKKCLAMRSVVKKSSAALIMGVGDSSNRRRGHGVVVGAIPNAGDVAAHQLDRSNRQAYGGNGNASMMSGTTTTLNMLGGANPGLQMNCSPRFHMQMPPSNSVDRGLDLMQQRQRYITNISSELAQRATASAAARAVCRTNQDDSAVIQPCAGISSYNNIISSLLPESVEEVHLASIIMKEIPALDAWQALQMAKSHRAARQRPCARFCWETIAIALLLKQRRSH